jgi:hypothetical protein
MSGQSLAFFAVVGATSTPAAPIVATPAAPPPFGVRPSASTPRAGGVSAAKVDFSPPIEYAPG